MLILNWAWTCGDWLHKTNRLEICLSIIFSFGEFPVNFRLMVKSMDLPSTAWAGMQALRSGSWSSLNSIFSSSPALTSSSFFHILWSPPTLKSSSFLHILWSAPALKTSSYLHILWCASFKATWIGEYLGPTLEVKKRFCFTKLNSTWL